MRAQRLALIGGIALAIALTPALTVTVLAAEPTVVVQPGDTLTGIARRHGVSVRRLAELNDLADPNRIFVGQRLRVGGHGSSTSGGARTIRAPRTIHVVSRGSSAVGHRPPLRRQRRVDRRGQRARQPQPHLRRPAPRHPRAHPRRARHAPEPAAGAGVHRHRAALRQSCTSSVAGRACGRSPGTTA